MPEIGSIDTAAATPATPKKKWAERKRKYKMSASKKAELSAAAKKRWAERKGQAPSVPEVSAPLAPPPAVLMLQEDVVVLIRSRAAFRDELMQSQAILQQAQAQFQIAQARLQAIEQEVQYLHAQIGQMQGGASFTITNHTQEPMYVNPAALGIGSVPTPINQYQSPDGVNRAHADRSLAMV